MDFENFLTLSILIQKILNIFSMHKITKLKKFFSKNIFKKYIFFIRTMFTNGASVQCSDPGILQRVGKVQAGDVWAGSRGEAEVELRSPRARIGAAREAILPSLLQLLDSDTTDSGDCRGS